MLIKSELFNQSGGFDSDFFAHMEEIDLCWRIKKMGYSFRVNPESKIYHYGGGTLQYESSRKIYLNFRNNLTMIVKNHEGILIFKILIRLCLDGVAGFKFLLSGNFSHLISLIKAHFWFHFHFVKNLKKRKKVKQLSTKFNDRGLFKGSILWAYFIKGNKTFSTLNHRKLH